MAIFHKAEEDLEGKHRAGGHHEAEHEGKGDEKGEHGAAGDAKKKKGLKGHEMHIAIIIGLVGLVLTWILFKRSSSTAATTSATAPATVAGSTPASTSGTASDPAAEAAISQLGSAFNALAGQEQSDVSGLTAAQTAASGQQSSDIAGLTAGQNAQAAQAASTQLQNQAATAGLAGLISSLGQEVQQIGSQPAYTPPNNGTPNSQAGAPPPLSAQLQQALAAAGEHIVQVISDPTGGFLYLGSNGGVFNEGGSQFYGSYVGYPGSVKVQAPGSATGISASPNGGYTEVFSSGATYSFGPGIFANQTGGVVPAGTPATG